MNSFTFTGSFNVIESKIAKIEREYRNIALNQLKTYLLPIIQLQIREFILDGGSNDPQFSWGYWQRTGGVWGYHKGKATSFSNGWSNATILPIHPMSFLARSVNRTPRSTMYALNDTRELINSFTSISDFITSNGANMFIGSTSAKLDYHEVDFKYKRKILEPYSIEFGKNKVLHQSFLNKICYELEKI